MKLSEHFDDSEFECKDGSPLPPDFARTIAPTVDYLEAVRAALCELGSVGVQITCGHRSWQYNQHVPGAASNSAHLEPCHAADFCPLQGYDEKLTYEDFYALCDKVALRPQFASIIRLGKYPRNLFVHADCMRGKMGSARWTK